MTSKRLIALFLGASLAGGCATANRGSLTTEYANPATPAFDRGGPAPSDGPSLHEHMKMIQHLQARPVMKASAGANAESADRELAAALERAAGSSSAENQLRVADEYVRL